MKTETHPSETPASAEKERPRAFFPFLALILGLSGGVILLAFSFFPTTIADHIAGNLPTPPPPVVDSVRIDVFNDDWPVGWTAYMGMAVGHDDLHRTDDCYYFIGPDWPESEECWFEQHNKTEDWFDEFLCGVTCYNSHGNNYYICRIERDGDGRVLYSRKKSYTTVFYIEGDVIATCYTSEGEEYEIGVELHFHEL